MIEVSSPARPRAGGSRVSSDAWSVSLLETADGRRLIYLADGERGMKIIDATDPRRPVRLASFPVGDVRTLRISGQRLYAGGPAGLIIFDLSAPLRPRRLGSLNAPGTLALAVSGTPTHAPGDSRAPSRSPTRAAPEAPAPTSGRRARMFMKRRKLSTWDRAFSACPAKMLSLRTKPRFPGTFRLSR